MSSEDDVLILGIYDIQEGVSREDFDLRVVIDLEADMLKVARAAPLTRGFP